MTYGYGYCTVDDVRRAMVATTDKFDGTPWGDNNSQVVLDAITGLTEWLQKGTKRHWYESAGLSEDDEGIVAGSVESRDDEHSLPTHGGYVFGSYTGVSARWTTESGTAFKNETRDADPKEQIRLSTGDVDEDADDDPPAYTRIRLERKDVSAVNTLNVVNESGGYDDWTSTKTGGVGNSSRGDDWWVRVNNRGVSELYLDIHSMDDDLPTLNNAVYVDIDFGADGIPQSVRRGVAFLAASQLVLEDDLKTRIPDQGQFTNVETKGQVWERRGLDLLSPHFDESMPDQGPERVGGPA